LLFTHIKYPGKCQQDANYAEGLRYVGRKEQCGFRTIKGSKSLLQNNILSNPQSEFKFRYLSTVTIVGKNLLVDSKKRSLSKLLACLFSVFISICLSVVFWSQLSTSRKRLLPLISPDSCGCIIQGSWPSPLPDYFRNLAGLCHRAPVVFHDH